MRATTIRIMLAAVFLLRALLGVAAQPPGQLSLTVTGVRNEEGVVRCGLYNSPDTFPKPGQQFRGVIARISNQEATCVFTGVPAGTYAIAFFHASQNESQLTYGAFGKPQQGFGFSNNASGLFGPPSFSAASFTYSGGNQRLQAALSY